MKHQTLIACCLLAALAGCGQKAEEASAEAALETATGGDADVDIDNGQTQVTVQTEDGPAVMSAGENVSLPADFPADIVLAPERRIISMYQAAGAVSFNYTTAGALPALLNEQAEAMKSQGWTETMRLSTDNRSGMLGYSKDSREAMFSYGDDGAGTVTVSVQVPAKK